MDLVGRDLLALAGAAHDDAAVGVAVHDGASDVGADRRIVARLGGVGAEVEDLVTESLQVLDEVCLQVVAGVVGADGDTHGRRR